jgi:hypothetical protein
VPHTQVSHIQVPHTQVPHTQVPHKCHTHKCHTHKCHTHKCHTQQVPHPQVPHTTSATHNKDDTHIVLPVVVFVVVSPKPGMAAGSGVPQCLQFLFLKKNTKQVKHDIFISQNTLHIKRGVTITNHQSPSIIKHHQASSSIIKHHQASSHLLPQQGLGRHQIFLEFAGGLVVAFPLVRQGAVPVLQQFQFPVLPQHAQLGDFQLFRQRQQPPGHVARDVVAT